MDGYICHRVLGSPLVVDTFINGVLQPLRRRSAEYNKSTRSTQERALEPRHQGCHVHSTKPSQPLRRHLVNQFTHPCCHVKLITRPQGTHHSPHGSHVDSYTINHPRLSQNPDEIEAADVVVLTKGQNQCSCTKSMHCKFPKTPTLSLQNPKAKTPPR